MKTLLWMVLFFSAQAYSILPNTEYYKAAENRIIALKLQVETINVALVENKNHPIKLQLKQNMEKEIALIKQRVELYKKLESQNLIMYSTP